MKRFHLNPRFIGQAFTALFGLTFWLLVYLAAGLKGLAVAACACALFYLCASIAIGGKR